MTEEELRAIAARAAAATPGPWTTSASYQVVITRAGDEGYLVAECGSSESPDGCEGNAPFIAHARTDIPALVAEVRRLREMVPRWTKGDAGTWRLTVHERVVGRIQLEPEPGGRWYEWPIGARHPDLPTACRAACRRLGLPYIPPPEKP